MGWSASVHPDSTIERDTTSLLQQAICCFSDLLTGIHLPNLTYLSFSQPQSDQYNPHGMYNSTRDSTSEGEGLYDLQ